MYRDYVGMKAELGRKSESSRDVDLAFQNPVSEATTDTPNPMWRCQACLAIRFSDAQFSAHKAEPKQSFLLSTCRFETCGNTWAHETCLSIMLSGLDTGTVIISLLNISLSMCGTASHNQSCVWQFFLTGCVLKLSFHLPWWHHFLCCAEKDAPEVSYWQSSSQRQWKLKRSLEITTKKCLINQRTKTSTVGISMQCCLDMPGWKHGESLKKAFLHCLWKPVIYG